MMKFILVSVLLISNVSLSFSQVDDLTAIKGTLSKYMTGLREPVNQSFSENATLQSIHFQTGKHIIIDGQEYIRKLNESPNINDEQKPWRREVLSIDIEGTAASAKIINDTGTAIIYDYILLLEINGEWKIVSKIFVRL